MTDPRAALHGADDSEGEQLSRADALRGWLHTTAQLASIPPPDPLIDGWLFADSLAWIFGERGHAKTFAAIDLASCVSSGLPWHGYTVKSRPVLYAVLEGASGMHQRMCAWQEHYATPAAVTFLVPRTLHVIADALPLAEIAGDIGAGLIVIDTQNRATVGLDENSSVDMGHMIASLDLLRQRTRACVLVVHHTGAGSNRPRGHTSIDGAATSMIRVHKDGALVVLKSEKQKDTNRMRGLYLTATEIDGSMVLTQGTGEDVFAHTDSETMIRDALRNLVALQGGATHAELKRACAAQGMKESTFNWALKRQNEKGGVMKDSSRRYTIVHPGQGTI